MKRVLSVQDLSCLGKCSLTVALPVISAMGCECAVLPTAVLSTHTAFPDPHCRSLTEDIPAICQHWQSVGAAFDVVSVGYLADPVQAELVGAAVDAFCAVTVIDPAMGDHGRLYSGLHTAHVEAMAQLCRKGTVLLPNVTEAALLTGIPYRDTPDSGYLQELLSGMMDFGTDTVVITSVSCEDGKTGFIGANRKTGSFSYQAPRLPKAPHGTGDLFAAVVAGGLASGMDPAAAGRLGARFVERVISQAPEVTPFGVPFEAQLPWLWQQLQLY